jgi:hypothetical protein
MVNGTTLHTGNNAHQLPEQVKQVTSMVRALSNKYVPVPLLEEVEINLLQSLKDFRHHARKRVAAINLRKMRTNIPQPEGQPTQRTTTSDSSTASNMIYGKNLPRNLMTTKNNMA